MTTKTFSSAGNAKRAAKAAGLADSNVAVRKEADGRFTFHDVNVLAVTESTDAPADPAETEALKAKRVRKASAEKPAKAAKPVKAHKEKAAKRAAKGDLPAEGSKNRTMYDMLVRTGGASEAEVCEATGWTRCSGFMLRLSQRLNRTLHKSKEKGQPIRYTLVDPTA